ncbi:MAG: cytochrome c [Bacteroidia bacterium]|nr:cytochrome c [Bacteroidia bacterium]
MNHFRLPAIILLIASSMVYSGFVYTMGTEKDYPVSLMEEARQGKILWQLKNCSACHQLYGLGGYMGPDLTNVISANGKGELFAEALIRNGTNVMPNYHLSNNEVNSLVAFLKYVDASGKFPIKEYRFTSYGTVENNSYAK